MHSAMAYIGDRLWRLRQERDLSQIQLALQSGLSPSTIFALEHNYTEPHYRTVLKLAETLGVEPSELLRLWKLGRG